LRVLWAGALLLACARTSGTPAPGTDAEVTCGGVSVDAAPSDAGTPAPDASEPPGDPPAPEDAAFDEPLPGAPDAGAPEAGEDGAADGPGSDATAGAARVLIVSIDGLRPDAIAAAPAPNLIALTCSGAYSWTARTIEPSLTLPSHASMLSGFLPAVHGLHNNDVRPGYIAVPTVLTLAHQAGKRAVMVVGKQKFLQLAPPGALDVVAVVEDGEEAVADRAIAEARAGFDLMFVHFPGVDLVGHAHAWMSADYLTQVAASDAAFGRLLAEIPPEVTVIVTADHGGSGFIHWSGVPEDFQIPWIIRGPRVRRGLVLMAPISTVDTAATAAKVLGLSLAAEAPGRAVTEALEY
jgi:hypothetical protein